MATSAQSVLRSVIDQLTDKASVAWKIGELVRYLNAGQREAINIRPDAMSTNATLALAAGAKQSMPADALLLLKVIRNSAGSLRTVTKCDMDRLGAVEPNWSSATPAAEILHYMYDEKDPDVFYVYPPAIDSSASLDIVYSQYPTAIGEPADGQTYVNVTGNISLPDVYSGALVDYVLYRAYDKNNGAPGNGDKAIAHLATFRAAVAAGGTTPMPAPQAAP